jgi:HlyD family secretion protein
LAASRNNGNGFLARNRWWLFAGGVVLLVILLAAFNSMHGDIVPIRTARVSYGNIRSVISTNGKIEPVENFEAHAPVATTVKRVVVKEGDHVRRGQLLLQLDDGQARTDAAKAVAQLRGAEADINAVQHGGTQEEVVTTQAQLVKARADRDNAKRNLDAVQGLVKNGAASVGELNAAQAAYQSAQANVDMLEKKLNDRYSKPEVQRVDAQKAEAEAALSASQDILNKSNVRAPFDGVVYSLPVRAGNYVQPGQLLLQEADLSKVRLRAYVDEPDVGRLSPGQPIEVTWDGLPGRTWQGKLTSVPATITAYSSRNVGEITTQLENPDYKLLPNTNVTVLVVTAEHKGVLMAPREAVRMDDEKPYVLEVRDDELHRRDVQTSIFNLTQVEITKGLTDKDIVALSSVNNKPLRDGLAVKVIQ